MLNGFRFSTYRTASLHTNAAQSYDVIDHKESHNSSAIGRKLHEEREEGGGENNAQRLKSLNLRLHTRIYLARELT